jgi:hypothetical protein
VSETPPEGGGRIVCGKFVPDAPRAATGKA